MLKRLLILAVVALLPTAAHAQQFFATNNLNALLGGTGDSLVQFDFATGNFTTIGEIGGGGIPGIFGGLDFDDDTSQGFLIGSIATNGASVGEFYEINPVTAAATLIGNASEDMNDLALNPTDNTMYGVDVAGELYRDDDGDNIPEVLIGAFGIGGTSAGLAFDSNGDLYLLDLDADAIFTVAAADVQAGNLSAITTLVALPYDANFSQGLYFSDGTGYHAAINADTVSAENYTFNASGSYTLSSSFATDTASGLPEVEVGDFTMVPMFTSGCIAPNLLTPVRGVLASGGLSSIQSSDNVRLEYNPGFTINDTEAPVWLEFEAVVGTNNTTIDMQIESQASTPGLSYTVEFFNQNVQMFEIMGVQPETFSADSVLTFNGSVGAHVDSAGGVRSRVGWRQTGFVILFPWTVRVDHVCWNVN